jgi:hypothetical protein
MKGTETFSGAITAPPSQGPSSDQILSDFVALKSSDHIQISYLINILNLVSNLFRGMTLCLATKLSASFIVLTVFHMRPRF